MSKDPQRLPDYLGSILQAIDRINRYSAGMDEAGFLQHDMAQDAVIRNFEVLGAASRNIERDHPGFAAAHPELPLAFAYEMRNALRTAISRLIWILSGEPSRVTCRVCSCGFTKP